QGSDRFERRQIDFLVAPLVQFVEFTEIEPFEMSHERLAALGRKLLPIREDVLLTEFAQPSREFEGDLVHNGDLRTSRVAFRSAKGHPFAERKATLKTRTASHRTPARR